MADSKITALTELTTVADDDALAIVDDTAGVPVTKKITKANLVKDIPVSALADGTDGELITWSAAGTATTVAAGTASQVLTSNGAGAAPTFQDAAGGGLTEFFVPVTYQSTSSTNTPTYAYNNNSSGTFPSATLDASSLCQFVFKLPSDFTTFGTCKIVVFPDATETITWDLETSAAANGENAGSGISAYANKTEAVTVSILEEIDLVQGTTVFDNWTANDYVQITFLSDTSNIRVIGLSITYS